MTNKEIKLIGFNFSKILAEKNPEFDGKLEIKPSMNIASIEKHRFESTKQEAVKVNFSFGIDYSALGKMNFEGTMYLSMDAKSMKETLTGWKDKKLDKDIHILILNIIMQKSSLKALQFEEEIGLPPHVQLPRLTLGQKESKK